MGNTSKKFGFSDFIAYIIKTKPNKVKLYRTTLVEHEFFYKEIEHGTILKSIVWPWMVSEI